MNILVDIVHPADVLFFYNPIRIWQGQGHEVAVVSRDKDVTQELLDSFEIRHRRISSAGSGVFSLGLELIRRDLALFNFCREFRPQVMCGFGGVAISHVGKLLGIPSLSFYDTERAPLQHTVTLPFITHLYVPESYDGPVAKNRTTRFAGTKDLSYFHPENFKADRQVAIAAGLESGAKNYFLRLVGWQANHDIGRSGWQDETLRDFTSYLAGRGRVHISSERPLPQDLELYRYSGSVREVHHLLAHCDACFGESATMAGEAVLLGVPAAYATSDRRSYTDELASRGLLWKVPQVSPDTLRRTAELIEQLDGDDWERRIADYLSDKVNLADFIVEETMRRARPVS